eukprot:1209601-Rhodomonas_salina.5
MLRTIGGGLDQVRSLRAREGRRYRRSQPAPCTHTSKLSCSTEGKVWLCATLWGGLSGKGADGSRVWVMDW